MEAVWGCRLSWTSHFILSLTFHICKQRTYLHFLLPGVVLRVKAGTVFRGSMLESTNS